MHENHLVASGQNFRRLGREKSWLRPCRPGCMKRLMLNIATTGRRLRPGALLILY